MFLSRSCEYGIRATIYVAAHESDGYVPIRVIGRELGLSGHFLTKILQQLTQKGIMQSHRGPSGGVSLAKAASKISLHDIVVAIDGADVFTECVLGLPGCGNSQPCPLHDKWMKTRAELTETFQNADLKMLANLVNSNNLRLAV
jgi:Rrf2 family protein